MKILALLSSITLFQVAGAAPAIGLNFSNNFTSTTMAGGTADGFNGWTDTRPNGSTTTAHTQTTPLALGTSGVTATWSASGSWSAGDNTNKEHTPYRLYLDDGGSGVRVTIQGLAGWLAANGMDSYQIRSYASSDFASGFLPVSIRSGTSATGTVLHTMTPPVLGNGLFPTGGSVPAAAGVARGYVDSPNTLTADEITLTIPARSAAGSPTRNVRGPLAAFKITALKAQTITFANVAPATVGDAPVTLAASASSGLPVTLTSSNPAIASVTGMTLSFLAEGTVTLTARQPGNADFLPAAEVQRRLRVYSGIKIPQTITFSDPGDPVHGEAPLPITASSSSGLPLEFSSSDPAVAAVEGGRLIARFPGTATITARQPGDLEFSPATPVAHEVEVLPGLLTLPRSIERTMAHDAGPLTVEIPVADSPGIGVAWWTGLDSPAPWLKVIGNAGTSPVTLKAVFDSSAVPPGDHHSAIYIQAGELVFRIPLRLSVTSGAPVEHFNFLSPGQTPASMEDFSASGKFATFTLGFPPAPGSELPVIRLTGSQPIAGTFENLPQGAPVVLSHAGVVYRYAADYLGGDGNDFVLRWASQRILAWGSNVSGQLGDGTNAARTAPAPGDPDDLLDGHAIRSVHAGASHSIALLVDGRMAAWGLNDVGQLGDGSLTSSTRPVWVDHEGVLEGRVVVRVACGTNHTLALCSDGTLVAWGNGISGQLGYGGRLSSAVPVRVDQSGILTGKRIVGMAAGYAHSVVICDDSTLVAWGSNLDDGFGSSATISDRPRPWDPGSHLAGKSLVEISAGSAFNLVRTSTGLLYSWGNGFGLGQSSGTPLTPFPVTATGALAGRPVVAVSSRGSSNLVLCADGRVVEWGGNASNFQPALVDVSGVLAGRTVNQVACGALTRLVKLSNNTLAGWKEDSFSPEVPALVDLAALKPDERLGPITSGDDHFLVMVDSPPAPAAVTLAATGIADSRAVLRASVKPNGDEVAVAFEFGPTPAYGQTIAATPALVSGIGETQVSAAIDGLSAGSDIYFRVIAAGKGGTARGAGLSFTTTDFASLAGLPASHGTFSPDFNPRTTRYHLVVPHGLDSITLTPLAKEASSTVRVAGSPVASGNASAPQALAVGNNTITTEVISPDGENSTAYQLTVTRLPGSVTLDPTGTPSLSVEFLAPGGHPLPLALGSAPPVGTRFTLVEVTGPSPAAGRFSGLEHGQSITLEHAGVSYDFAVNYHGGDGNDLVLQWANTRPITWGYNSNGQLGTGTAGTNSAVPVPVNRSGILAGKTVIALTGGGDHSLALCSDGTLASWGNGSSGRLGRGPLVSGNDSSSVPVPVYRDGVLAGRTVVALAAGSGHSLVLCSDGTLAAWGNGSGGQMGNGSSNSTQASPVAVDLSGVLAGRRVVGISACGEWSLAVCDDGRVAAWGNNNGGQLGTGNTTASNVPVLVENSGALAGRRVVSAAAGRDYALALCDDGSMVAWGTNNEGQFGNGTTSSTVSQPVPVDRSGVLSGKSVVGIAAGSYHGLAWCSDGTLAAWGQNDGRLGDGTSFRRTSPVLVTPGGVLAGKTVVRMLAGTSDSVAFCADGTVAHWGNGFNTGMSSNVPAALNLTAFSAGERVIGVGIGSVHGLAVVAMPPPPRQVETLAAASIRDTAATLQGRASGNGSTAAVRFEYGVTPALGKVVIPEPAEISGTSIAGLSAGLEGLLPGTTYHYRVVAENAFGSVAGETLTFTTSRLADLAGLTLDRGSVVPAFSPARLNYDVTLPADATEIFVTPGAFDSSASVTVSGTNASPGVAVPVPLVSNATIIPVTVTSADQLNSRVYHLTVTRLPQSVELTASPPAVVRAGGFSLAGAAPGLSIGRAPGVGESFLLLENTGAGPINGRFDDLAHGLTAYLSHGGIDYPYLVNYYGGSGNDLVLEWANTRLFSWGYNSRGQLGDGTTTDRLLPVPVDASGALAGRIVVGGGTGEEHSAVWCADGSLLAWGRNAAGQLGTGGNTSNQLRPVAVDQTGALAGKQVAALVVGRFHTLARCDDGTVFGWGGNSDGQLGDGSTTNRGVPVATDMSGVLAGRRVAAVTAGAGHNLALCDDGTLVAWGFNSSGQLGNGTTVNSTMPVAVDQRGVLAGKQVVAIAAGNNSSYVLCSDGTVVAWGGNSRGQLGDGSTVTRLTPVLVRNDGVLAGKTVRAIASGSEHVLALCGDGTLAAWGSNGGQLGNGGSTDSNVPVLVNRSGVLAGKVVLSIHAASNRSFALCDDGTLAAWGNNASGALGNNSSAGANTPVLASMVNLLAGEKMIRPLTGCYSQSNLAIIASPVPPRATTLAASDLGDNRALLHGSVLPNGQSATVSFEYGTSPAYGFTVAASPGSVDGTSSTAVSTGLTDLLPGKTYHFRVVATGTFGVVRGENQTFKTSQFATLADLRLDAAPVEPAFEPLTASYHAVAPPATVSLRVTPVAAGAGSTIEVNGQAVASGSASGAIDLLPGDNEVVVTVTAAGGASRMDYRVTVTRIPESFVYRSAADDGIRVPLFSGSGLNAGFALEYPPVPGTSLRVIEQSGIRPIQAEFDNLAHGQEIELIHDGVTYRFVANYFGGDGNDLVLHWADTVVSGWGRNQEGQLGIGSTTDALLQSPVDAGGVLDGKTVIAVASGSRHSLALCSDGTIAAWGLNSNGELGDGTTTLRNRPVTVDRSGALAGKTVVAIAAADFHSLALCADGSLFAWGSNESGRLGNGSGTSSSVPVPVTSTGALAGKRPVAISCAGASNLVLCEDGSLVSWGSNGSGQLGLAGFSGNTSDIPRQVDASGALAGRQVIRISAGANHTMVLCSDGSLVAWGNHQSDLWGNGNSIRSIPVLVPATGLFSGKSIVDVSLGADHGFALCDDRAIIAWGRNTNGRLGNNSTTSPAGPVLVDRTGILADRPIVRVIARIGHSLALCADGAVAAWGLNSSGELGNGSTTQSLVPAWVTPNEESPASATVALSSGVGSHSLRITGAPPAPRVVTRDATGLSDRSATLLADVTANGGEAQAFFEFGTTTDYGQTIAATPAQVAGTSAVEASTTIDGLLPDTTYHFRAIARKGGITRFGEDRSFTTTEQSTLASLALEGATLSPGFSKQRFHYLATVPFASMGIRVTPSATRPEAVVQVNGHEVPSGGTSPLLPLQVGANPVTVEVDFGNGAMTSLYQVVVTRLPEAFALDAPSQAPLALDGFVASGFSMPVLLNHAPAVGADLILIRNTGGTPIQGYFDNLPHGQVVKLIHGNVSYPYVANYRGGGGADLVLHWANHRATSWGRNDVGQLGDQTVTNRSSPVNVALPRNTVLRLAAGDRHGFALYADGTIDSWGYNDQGQLGRPNGITNTIPAPVVSAGVFGTEPVTSIAAGKSHVLALGLDGTLAAWGLNSSGQLGDGSTTSRPAPVRVDTAGALAGKRVLAIAAGGSHSLALCGDGTLAAWGLNNAGQLGNGTTTLSPVPVWVDLSGVLAGKRIVAIAAGENHSMALCSDGTLAAWGSNSSGQLGNNTTTSSSVPVQSAIAGALAGKAIIAVASGDSHALGLASDGTLAAWGLNSFGQLGNNSNTASSVPVLVSRSGILSGKTVVGIHAGNHHGFAACNDGTLAAWGRASFGTLGNGNTTDAKIPVQVGTGDLLPGQRRTAADGGAEFSLGLVAMPPPPETESLPASAIRDTAATLNARVNGNGFATKLTFEFGPTAGYGSVVDANPPIISSAGETSASAPLTGLIPGTTYHFRVVALNAGGTSYGEDLTFTTSSLASLATLTTDAGPLLPGFDPRQPGYVVTVPHATEEISLTAGLVNAGSTLTIDGQAAVPGAATGPFPLATGNRVIPLVVTLADGSFSQAYHLTVTRLPALLSLDTSTQAALTVPGLVAAGKSLPLALNHTPRTGASLRVIDNSGTGAIAGRFQGMEQGARVTLRREGIDYSFVANYHGGDGNDLVLDWGNTRVIAVGNGDSGQLGEGIPQRRSEPVPVDASGALAGRTVVALSAGSAHSLALCADGGVVAWGLNSSGQLGTGSLLSSLALPAAVDTTGVLDRKQVVAVSAGSSHSLALCSDGTLVAWGLNTAGQLGNGSLANSPVPVEVDRSGALAGKTVVAISAGDGHNLVLCSDGSVAAWGVNSYGQLGDNLTVNSPLPKTVHLRDIHGQGRIIAVAAGSSFSLALDADGIVSAWGRNSNGQLGNSSLEDRKIPVAVVRTGVLAERKVVAIQTGSSHALAICSDGTLAAWGQNQGGQVGDGSGVDRNTPVLVQRTGGFAGKSVTSIRAGNAHNYALATDGTFAAWGSNFFGQLSDTTNVNRLAPAMALTLSFHPAERLISMVGGSTSNHGLGLLALPPAPAVETLAATGVEDNSATLRAEVSPQGQPTSVVFEYGTTTAYGFTLAANPQQVDGVATATLSAPVTGLLTGTTYHFRAVAHSAGGTVTGEDRRFTTGTRSALSGLGIFPGVLHPSFAPAQTRYLATVPAAVASISVTATAATAGAEIRVNGTALASGATSPPVSLQSGENEITIDVTSADSDNSQTYRIRVLRLPAAFEFSSPSDSGISVEALAAGGSLPPVHLLYPPPPGTRLPLIRTGGLDPIAGEFENLRHGETLVIEHGGLRYPFVANYFGGDGNDLVLHWANTRPFAFGTNNVGQLGNGDLTLSSTAVPVIANGTLRGRTILSTAAGRLHNLAVLDDGSIAAWGYNESGILGDGTTISRSEPVAVDKEGILAGRPVIAVAAGYAHSIALCADGTIATWGSNQYGQLGDNSRTNRSVPGAVDSTGILAGRRVVAIAAGGHHSLALCSDGSLAVWGRNQKGQLGNQSNIESLVPVAVNRGDVLAGKAITAIVAGMEHSLVLCSDGTLAAWGANHLHQLGDNGSFDSNVPVRVRQGDRAGKEVVAIRAGNLHNLALCSDGSIVAWGSNDNGRLGIGGTAPARIPTAVVTGKPAVEIAAATAHSVAVFADGSVSSWGANNGSQLGNGTTTAGEFPAPIASGALPPLALATGAAGGENFSLVVAALPPAPVVETLAATGTRDRSAILNASVIANGQDAGVRFELGTSPEFLDIVVSATPDQVTGAATAAVEAMVSGLMPGTGYYFRAVASNGNGETTGEVRSFTTTAVATLTSLLPGQGTLGPAFDPARTDYWITLPHQQSTLSLTPVAAVAGASVTIHGATVPSGTASPPVALAVGDTPITVVVSSADGLDTSTYRVLATRLPAELVLGSPLESLITAETFSAAGAALEFDLGFAPVTGSRLRLLTLTGLDPLIGRFENLAQGDIVGIDHDGSTYRFVVNYYGGSGNDLELQWLNSRVVAWGANNYGELGINSTSGSKLPVPVDASGVLDRYPVVQLAGNSSNTQPFGAHHFALGADGSLVGWGRRAISQFSASYPDSRVPLAIDTGGALLGKPLAAISSGSNFTLMLAADGTLAASGGNQYGVLGNRSFTGSELPVAVWTGGALRGKQVVAISAGLNHSLALCSDGTVVAWGSNQRGELGIEGSASRTEPVLVRGLPAGQRVLAISAGDSFSLALLENGEVFGWGLNGSGQLGTGANLPQNHPSPVPVDRSGVLAGKRIVAISSGAIHSLALSDDGKIFSWGANFNGQLGIGGTTQTNSPVEVSGSGLLNGRTVTAISAMRENSLALCSDGTLAVWGANILLGNNVSGSSTLPIAISTEALRPGEVFMAVTKGSNPEHAVALTALPLPAAEALAASSITGVSARLHGTVNARGNDAVIRIEYGLDESFGSVTTALPAAASGYTGTSVSAEIAGLTPETRYFYRVVAESYGGIVRSPVMTFTTLSDNAKLERLTSVGAFLSPQFQPEGLHYLTSVDFTRSLYHLRPVTQHPGARVTVNGVPVASGSISQALPLAVGNNPITILVTAEDGITTRTYTNTVTRLPELFELTASGQAPVSAEGFAIGAQQYANLRLRYHPPTGSSLTLVENTGLTPIERNFGNIAHGQRFTLRHDGVDYAWVANYFGGTGNDLVLHWADTRISSWGLNNYGQLGDGSTTLRSTPVAVDDSGLLAGKTVFSVSGGYLHTLALCADGTLAAWGYNVHGQLGNNLTTASATPVAVDASGALAGKTVVAVSAGPYHNLALCSDGTLVAWGYNNYGQLGTGDTQTRRTPVLVPPLGALAGKRVTAIAAGAYHSLALCSDGTVVGWGYNDEGELGDGTTTRRMVAVAVDQGGALAGKKVAMIRGGQYHSLALCTDGSVVSWGYNPRGQLGDGSTANRLSPVDITGSGELGGRTVIDLATGGSHSLALCSDGTLAAWGYNLRGQLGRSGGGQSPLPLTVAIAPSADRMAAGAFHSLTLDADGAIAAWGDHANGQLGTPLSPPAGQAATPDTLAIHPGSRTIAISTGSGASHSIALVALPVSGAPPVEEAATAPDDDPIPALLRYAFGLGPDESDPSRLPRPLLENGRLVARFARPEGVTGIVYGAEWSTTLQAGSWQDIPNTGTADAPEFITPESAEPSLFMRLKVTEELATSP